MHSSAKPPRPLPSNALSSSVLLLRRGRQSVFLVALALSVSLPSAASEPETYAIDPVHTRVLFAVSHAGFSKAMGTVSGNTGTLRFDPDDWRTARLDVTVPVAQMDLGDAKWNKAVLAGNLLDGKRHPQAHFVSTTVEPGESNHARVCGDLTLRGVTRPLCLDVTLNALKRHPLPPFHRTAGFSATATLSRKAFGITAWPGVIGDEVALTIEAEAVRSSHMESSATATVQETSKPEPPATTDEPPTDPPPQPGNPDCICNGRESNPPLPASTDSTPDRSQD
ncbi:YceI family protein [Lysobacter fragariae]